MPTTSGTQYWVRVFDYFTGTPANSSFTICVTDPPSNDNCSGATALTPAAICSSVTGNVLAAGQDLNNCSNSASTGYNDVWYSFTTSSTSGQTYIISVAGSSSFDPAFQVLSGACGSQTQVTSGCVNANSTAGGTETLTLQSGVNGIAVSTTYYIRVYNATSGVPATTTFTICITTPPLNDNCTVVGSAGAIQLTPASTCSPVPSPSNLDGATASTAAGLSVCTGATGANNDVWYYFVASTTGTTTVTLTGLSGYNPVAQVASNSCGGTFTSLGCTPVVGSNGTTSVSLSVTTGTHYYIRVYDASGAVSYGSSFTICVTTQIPKPINDNCSSTNAINIPVTSNTNSCTNVLGTVSGATNTESANGTCGTNTPNDVWYYFTAGSSSETVTITPSSGSTLQPVVEVFNGGCGTTNGGTSLGCTAATTSGGQASVSLTGLTSLSYYWFRVYNVNTTTPATPTFNVCVQQPVTVSTPVVTNTTCANAIPILCGSSITGNTTTATSTPPSTDCIYGGNTFTNGLWYVFIGDGSTVRFTTCAQSSYDTEIDVYTGTCGGTLSCVTSNDDYNNCGFTYTTTYYRNFGSGNVFWYSNTYYRGSQTNYVVNTVNGQLYYIFVSGYPDITYYTGMSGSYSRRGVTYSWSTVPASLGVAADGTITGSFTLTAQGNTCKTPVIPLPIQLLYFNGKSEGRRNLLEWATATETNNDYFTIEKSGDAINFEPMAKINGAGNSTSNLSYNTYDNNPTNGITYYRLKQTDYNGATTYSATTSVENIWSDVSVNNIRPNPTSNDVNFDFYSSVSGKVIIQVYDYMGSLIDTESTNVPEGNTVLKAKMEKVVNGIYTLKVSFDLSDFVYVTKIVKN